MVGGLDTPLRSFLAARLLDQRGPTSPSLVE
jgi:hypothetical protein